MSGMTREEAIKNVTTYVIMECENMPKQVIQALDVMRECTEKQIPKKPLDDHLIKTGYWGCPICKHMVDSVSNYCEHCGQALDWSEEEDSL